MLRALGNLPRPESCFLTSLHPSMIPASTSLCARIALTRNTQLTLGSDHADPNSLALAFWILQPCLLRLLLVLERLRQRRKLTADVLEEQPPFNDSGHESL